MMNGVFALAIVAGAVGQLSSPHYTPGKMALDMNVECVSLLGKNLYANKPQAKDDKRLEEAANHAAAQPDNPQVHVDLAMQLAMLRRYHEAAQAISKAIALNPSNADLYAFRGNAFLRLRLFEQAKADFENGIAVNPQSVNAWEGFGVANFLLKDFRKALDSLNKASEIAPSEASKIEIDMWREQAAQKLGKPVDLKTNSRSGLLSTDTMDWLGFKNASDQAAQGNQERALEKWRELTDYPDWTSLWVIAAEVEVAAVDGTKKMKPLV